MPFTTQVKITQHKCYSETN